MGSNSTPPSGLGEALRASAEAYALRTREGIRAGILDARAGRLRPPGADHHAARFLFGFTAPLTLLRVAWGDKPARASMVHRLLPPLLFVGMCSGIGVLNMFTTLLDKRHDPAALAEEARKEKDDDDNDGDEKAEATPEERKEAEERMAKETEAARAAVAGAITAAYAYDGGTPVESALSAAAAAVEAAGQHVEDATPRRKERPSKPPPPAGRLALLEAMMDFVKSKLAALLATLGVIEWILVWIGREHHDVIAYEAATLTGVPSEPPPSPPRLRLDAGWLKMKGWRALRFLIFLGLIGPVVWLVGMVPYAGEALGGLVSAAWLAYWASVFAIANTFLVWEEPVPPEWAPCFVRWTRAAGRVPFVGVPFRIGARILAWVTRGVWPACRAFEEVPWESAGMALARGIASVPMVYIVSRPFFGTAATHAYLAPRAVAGSEGREREEDAAQETAAGG